MIDTTIFENKTAAYYTLGCKLNFAETSTIGKTLAAAGVRKAREGERADICVINTCSVTELADKKCRQAIRRIHKEHPGAFVVATGCYAQLKPEEVAAIEGVDLVLGAEQKLDILQYINSLQKCGEDEAGRVAVTPSKDIRRFSPSCSADDRTRHFLKVQDGCDYFCSYCTIPYARGASRSATIPQVLQAVQEATAQGIREIILTGVNTGDFGRHSGEDFLTLLRELDKLDNIARYRISSIEPNLLTDDIIAFVASSSHFMPHFHIPLQSGSDDVLRLMRRRYTRDLFAEKVHTIRRLLPDAFIGVDIIAGMRGETLEYFKDSRDFIAALPVSQLHVFPYSERQGTRALDIPLAVPQEEKHRRVAELLHISETKHRDFCHAFEGTTRPVLFEDNKNRQYIYGFTDNYIKIRLPYRPEWINTIRPVRLEAGIIQEHKNQ